MRVFAFLRGLAFGLAFFPGVVAADDLALIFGDRGQIGAFQDPSGAEAGAFRDALSNAGFRLFEPHNRNIVHMNLTAQAVETAIEAGDVDRLVIVALGPFAHDGRDSWILSNNAIGASRLTVGATGLSMTALAGLADRGNIRAVVLAAPGVAPPDLGHGLLPGLGDYPRDARVTYVTGTSRQLATVLSEMLLQEGMSFSEAAQSAPSDVRFDGYLSQSEGLMGPAFFASTSKSEETGFWKAVQLLDIVAAYDAYLDEYPSGRFRKDAEQRIAYLRDEPERKAKAAEDDLRLSRDARRKVQRNLALLGFDPRGIDGVFGRGSRAAISAWQRDNGYLETGYINGNQLLQLRDQAQAEAKRQEAEAEKRRLEQERQDRAFWRDVGLVGDEPGLRAYLEKFPDGLFSDIARARLKEIEDARLSEAAREERDAWDAARKTDTIQGYKQFLNRFPESGFADAADARLTELADQQRNAALIERAKAEERQVAASEIARAVIEQRLAMLGADPGKVDGKFTDKTRRAIRQFQRARRLPVTGYVSRNTMVRLMAGR